MVLDLEDIKCLKCKNLRKDRSRTRWMATYELKSNDEWNGAAGMLERGSWRNFF